MVEEIMFSMFSVWKDPKEKKREGSLRHHHPRALGLKTSYLMLGCGLNHLSIDLRRRRLNLISSQDLHRIDRFKDIIVFENPLS